MIRYLLAQDGSQDLVFLDTIEGENTTFSVEVTDHPVEDTGVGSISDGSIKKPTQFEFSGFVSNTPIKAATTGKLGGFRGSDGAEVVDVPSWEPPTEASVSRNPITGEVTVTSGNAVRNRRQVIFQGLQFPDEFSRVKETILQLATWMQKKTLVSVVTAEYRHDNCLVEEFSYAGEGAIWSASKLASGGATFTIRTKQITLVRNARAEATDPKEDRGAKEVSKGRSQGGAWERAKKRGAALLAQEE